MPQVVIEIFVWLFGLCVGSFLNVVVYRLATGLSVAKPARSFCPRCRAGIAWYDNLPILSWFVLRGRCRHCRGLISVQYPLVEALTGLAFVLVYHLLLVAHARAGIREPALPDDLPLLIGWLVLVAGLVACAAMDIASYTVDVRITNVVLGVAIVMHAVWPQRQFFLPQAHSASTAAALAALLVGGMVLWWAGRRRDSAEPAEETSASAVLEDAPGSESRALRLAGTAATAAFVALAAWLVYLTVMPPTSRLETRDVAVAAALIALFAAVVLIGGQRRTADDEIAVAIRQEEPRARRTAWRELARLLWVVVAAVVVFIAVDQFPGIAAVWQQAVDWTPAANFAPVAGAALAIYGAVVGAAAGWLLRIVFTLIYGREAFGVGDIHILAAAGAAAGWDIALLGLLLSVGIALLGWLLGLLLKSTVMIPFGPWLALGFIAALWWNRPAQSIAHTYGDSIAAAWRQRPDLLWTAGGLMLVGSAAAIALARIVRRWVAPDSA